MLEGATSLLILEIVVSLVTSNTIKLETSQAFYHSYPIGEHNVSNGVDVVAWEVGHADTPSWMRLYRRPGSNLTWLYGTPNEEGDFHIQIVTVDLFNFDTSSQTVTYRVHNKNVAATHEVELRLFDLDIQDFFQAKLETVVEQIFALHLWLTPYEIYLTRICRPQDIHSRAPLDPSEKEGVIVRVGSAANLSEELLQLSREVKQLKRREPPCPKNYKKTSFEHIFRRKRLYVDWCSFALI